MRRDTHGLPEAAIRRRVVRWADERRRHGLRMDEGALSFVTFICCSYRDSPYKRELGG